MHSRAETRGFQQNAGDFGEKLKKYCDLCSKSPATAVVDDIRKGMMGSASQALQKPWIETPLVESSTLSRAAGCRIFLKLENLQPSGSFKSRGIGNLILSHITEAQHHDSSSSLPHFYSSSGGNAGLACVTAAVSLGYPATVVLPTSTEKAMILRLQAAGAIAVISHGDSWFYADEYLRKIIIPQAEARGEKSVYVPPFDHPLIWEGAGSMIEEIQHQMPNQSKPDAIICSVGGGGLFAGIMNGLDRVGWDNNAVQVLAVETLGADSLSQSVQKKELVTLPVITSIAKSLGAVRVAEHVFKLAMTRPNVKTVVLEDAEAAMASVRFADDERILVEPACGASVALAYDGRLERLLKDRGFGKESKVVVVVCGGSRVCLADLMAWREEFRERAEELGAVGHEKGEEMVPSSVFS